MLPFVICVSVLCVIFVLFLKPRLQARKEQRIRQTALAQQAYDKYVDKTLKVVDLDTNSQHTICFDTTQKEVLLDGYCVMHFFSAENCGKSGYVFVGFMLHDADTSKDQILSETNKCNMIALGIQIDTTEDKRVLFMWRKEHKPRFNENNQSRYSIIDVLS